MWPFSLLFGRGDRFCKNEFKELWSGFVDAYTDSINAKGPAACPPRSADLAPKKLQARFPAAKRLVAFGDVHGDLAQMKSAFMAAGVVDKNLRWCGGKTVAVQVGDILDRGDNEVQLMYILERLQREASRAGGALHVLNGNHETMNIAADCRYATAGGTAGFADWMQRQQAGCELKKKCGCAAGWSAVPKSAVIPPRYMPLDPRATGKAFARASAVQPGSAFTRRFFAEHPMVLQVGSTVFVHGGLHPEHVHIGVDKLNAMSQDWMEGKPMEKPWFLKGRDAVVWSRSYSHPEERACNCDMLQQTLEDVGARRMVVGHTIQAAGINGACDNQVLRVDVGMSRGCGGGMPQALEILDDQQVNRILEDGTRVPMDQEESKGWAKVRKPAQI
eukprot:jgi/Ulvmu1/8079/UM004_0316.1